MRVLSVVHQESAGPGVFAEVVGERGDGLFQWRPPEESPPDAEEHDAVLVFGGSMHVDQEHVHPWLAAEKRWLRRLLEAGVPVLGVCLGSQLLAEVAGAVPGPAARGPEIGWHEVELCPDAAGDPLLGSLPERFPAFEWHAYEFPLPPGAVALAQNGHCLQAFRLAGPAWGLQFHAEVVRASIDRWLEDADEGEADSARVRRESDSGLEAWNELGRGLCRRFLVEAESPSRG